MRGKQKRGKKATLCVCMCVVLENKTSTLDMMENPLQYCALSGIRTTSNYYASVEHGLRKCFRSFINLAQLCLQSDATNQMVSFKP